MPEWFCLLKINNDDSNINNMKNLFHKMGTFLFPKECNGLNNPLSNQLLYSQLKNRLIMMTQQPSSWIAKWKYTGALPLLFLALLLFSFRSKESNMPLLEKTSSSSDISLDASNIPPGSVRVTVDGHLLKENEDYIIDYSLGRLRIVNPTYLQPNTPINISFEDDAQSKPGLLDNTEQPIFPGCEKLNLMEIADCSHKKLFEYVGQHLKYPESMKSARIEGKVYVTFAITTNGFVAEARITKSLNPSADEAALEVVNSLNGNVGKWTPGTKEGIPVTMDMVLPISFVLGTSPDKTSNPDSTTQGAATMNPSTQKEELKTNIETMPSFPGGQEEMYRFIFTNIKYPVQARKKNISGTVILQYIVAKDGDLENVKVVRGIGGGCDEEAMRVVNLMPKWNPGVSDGIPVDVTFTLPIKFVLQ